MKYFLLLVSFLGSLQTVVSLGLTLPPTAFSTQQSLLLWTRQPEVDGNDDLDFSLRFVQGADQKDAGLAASSIQASSSQQFGTVRVVLPKQGTYQVIAVDDSGNNIGTSSPVVAVAPPASLSTSASSQPSATSSHASGSTRQSSKAPIIIVSIIAALLLLASLAILILLLKRRRHSKDTKRWTFDQDMMVQHPAPISPSSLHSTYVNPHSEDLEQGVHTLPPPVYTELPVPDPKLRIPDPVVYPSRMMVGPVDRKPTLRRLNFDLSVPQSPIGPRAPKIHPAVLTPSSALRQSARPMSPIPRSPSPRTHRQRAIADQIEILRVQMLEVEREDAVKLVKNHIQLSEMSEKMAWLREQQEGPWALGLTEVTPLGYDRYMA